MRNKFLLTLFCLSATVAFAGGFQVNLQGQKNTGMGHTGTGICLGASSAFFNPGAFAFCDSNQISAGASFIISRMRYRELYPGAYTTETEHQVGTPFTLFLSYKNKPEAKWNSGLAVYTPFGSGIRYNDNWLGQFVVREMSLKIIYVQPTFSYKITDKIGVGFGYVYGFGNFLLRKGIPVQDSQGKYGEAILTGKASGSGFNAGIYYQVTPQISLGASYRSGLSVTTDDGQASFTVPSYLSQYFPETGFSTSIGLPAVYNFGLGYKISDKTLFAADINYVGWSVYDTLSFDFKENTEKLADINSPREYEDSYILRAGLQHLANEKWTFRTGIYYDFTPVQNGYITPETPDANKTGITFGGTYKLGDKFNIDFSLLFIEGKKRTDTNLETQFGGTWKARAVIPGFSLEYLF
jgi:long-chain fatty acid transport protein